MRVKAALRVIKKALIAQVDQVRRIRIMQRMKKIMRGPRKLLKRTKSKNTSILIDALKIRSERYLLYSATTINHLLKTFGLRRMARAHNSLMC
jgi:hypothetical protein